MTDILAYIRETLERGDFTEARSMALFALSQRPADEEKARLTLNLAIATHRAGDNLAALKILNESGAVFERASLVIQASVHNERGIILYNLRRTKEARAEYKIASSLYKAAGDEQRRASTLNNLALLYAEEGEFREAHRCARAARKVWTKAEDQPRIAQSLDTLARILLLEGRTGEAARMSRQAISILSGTNYQGRLRQARATYTAILEAQNSDRSEFSTSQPTRARSIITDPASPRAP